MVMDTETLRKLELLNQLRLTEEQKNSVLAFFEERAADEALLDAVDTAEVKAHGPRYACYDRYTRGYRLSALLTRGYSARRPRNRRGLLVRSPCC